MPGGPARWRPRRRATAGRPLRRRRLRRARAAARCAARERPRRPWPPARRRARDEHRRGDRARAAGRGPDRRSRRSRSGEARMSDSTGVDDPHARPAPARVRELDAPRARRRATRSPRRDRTTAPGAGDVRARRATASAPLALPLLPRPVRRLRRHLRRELRLGRAGRSTSPASRTSTTWPRRRCRS